MRNKQERHHIWSDQRIYQRTYQCHPQGSSYQSRGLPIANDDKPYECCNYQCQRMYCKRLQPVRISQLHLRFPFFASFAFFVAKIIGNWVSALATFSHWQHSSRQHIVRRAALSFPAEDAPGDKGVDLARGGTCDTLQIFAHLEDVRFPLNPSKSLFSMVRWFAVSSSEECASQNAALSSIVLRCTSASPTARRWQPRNHLSHRVTSSVPRWARSISS